MSSSTGSLAGIASLGSVDMQFMHSRATLRKKGASNLLEGFEQGGKSLIRGAASGLWGVVAQPVKQFKADKTPTSVLKGVLKGFAGLITKPISGILDSVSKTAEGIQQTANEEPPEKLRIRPPRAFYLADDSIKEYSYEDAVFYRGLSNRDDRLVVGFGGLANGKSLVYLALTTQFLEAIDETSKRLLVPIDEVIATTLTDSNIKILFKTSGGRKSLVLTVVRGPAHAKQVYEELMLNLNCLQSKLF